MRQNTFGDKSILVQVTACWSRSMSLYTATWSQCLNTLSHILQTGLQTMASPMFVIFLPLLWWVSRHQIYSIDLSNQQLRTVPRTLNTDVDILILKNNDLRILDASSFDLYPNLVELSVEEYNITAVLDGSFDRQTKMEKISFRYNDIRQLPTSFGPSVYKIVEMDMYSAVIYGYAFKYPYFAVFETYGG